MLAASAQAARDARAKADALETVQTFNERLVSRRAAWFWPTVGAELLTKHHWLRLVCDGCETVIEMDLTVKRRRPDAPVSVALADVRCKMQRAWPAAHYRVGKVREALRSSDVRQRCRAMKIHFEDGAT
jgi:hypothetical protein